MIFTNLGRLLNYYFSYIFFSLLFFWYLHYVSVYMLNSWHTGLRLCSCSLFFPSYFSGCLMFVVFPQIHEFFLLSVQTWHWGTWNFISAIVILNSTISIWKYSISWSNSIWTFFGPLQWFLLFFSCDLLP